MDMQSQIIDEKDGQIYAVHPLVTLGVFPSNGENVFEALPDNEAKVFHRNGIKMNLGSGKQEHIRWLVGELNGVRAYIAYNEETKQLNVFLSDKELMP